MLHEKIMTTPTQLWHNTLDALTWQLKSASHDCAFPLKECPAHVSFCRGISPFWLSLVSQTRKCFPVEACDVFQWKVSKPAAGDRVSKSIYPWLQPHHLAPAYPGAVNMQKYPKNYPKKDPCFAKHSRKTLRLGTAKHVCGANKIWCVYSFEFLVISMKVAYLNSSLQTETPVLASDSCHWYHNRILSITVSKNIYSQHLSWLLHSLFAHSALFILL